MRIEQQSDMEGRIRAVYDEQKGRYGYRRITAVLCRSIAEPVNHKFVQLLMKKMGLRALIRAKKSFRGSQRLCCTNPHLRPDRLRA